MLNKRFLEQLSEGWAYRNLKKLPINSTQKEYNRYDQRGNLTRPSLAELVETDDPERPEHGITSITVAKRCGKPANCGTGHSLRPRKTSSRPRAITSLAAKTGTFCTCLFTLRLQSHSASPRPVIHLPHDVSLWENELHKVNFCNFVEPTRFFRRIPHIL